MDSDNLYMDIPQVDEKISKLKEERDVMKTALELIKTDILRMPEIWNGNTGDANYEVLVKYSTHFKEISDKLDSFVDSLQDFRDKYELQDKAISDKIDSNADINAV